MMQTTSFIRPSMTLRRRMIVGVGVAMLLTIVAIIYFFWQLNVLLTTLQDLKEENNRLALALETSQYATSLVVDVQNKMIERIPSILINDINASVRALAARKQELESHTLRLPEDDPMQEQITNVSQSLQSIINVAEGTVRHVEDNNWPAAEIQAAVLLKLHADIEWDVYQLVTMARTRRVEAETRANAAIQSATSVSVPLILTAVIITAVIVLATTRSVTTGVEQLTGSAQRLAEGNFDERIPMTRQDELGQLAQSFNKMANELQYLYSGLENQVEKRTKELARRSAQLEAAAQVAREASAIRDTDQLLDQTVHLISEQFGFYHAGIFLTDEARQYAVLQAASSPGGKNMLARRHELKIGEVGIVGYTAGSGEPRIALDVGTDAVFFDNPDLPNTRSEMALPLKIHGRTIGVLDVQSTQANAFTEEDVAVLQVMADQITLAIENARLLEEAQRALQELETLYGRRARETWREQAARRTSAYRYTGVGVEPVATVSLDTRGAQPSHKPIIVQEDGSRQLIAPIHLRGQTLGSITLRQSAEDAPWSDEETALVEELSTQIGLALDNARLLEETQQRAEQEKLIGDITARVRETLDVDTVLQTAIREIGQALGLAEIEVRMGEITAER
ncbi:MAG TPA: GAF domain-containing protein [Chloroflexi bacterium]|nr:GAF domain-containing protein [Chloroflexota bacterium]